MVYWNIFAKDIPFLHLPLKTSQHLHEFPLILIFGIATSPIVIHRLLPHAVSSLLCIELFQSLSCKEHLTTVLDKVKRKNFTSEIGWKENCHGQFINVNVSDKFLSMILYIFLHIFYYFYLMIFSCIVLPLHLKYKLYEKNDHIFLYLPTYLSINQSLLNRNLQVFKINFYRI